MDVLFPAIVFALFMMVAIVLQCQTRKKAIIHDHPKYKGYKPYTKPFAADQENINIRQKQCRDVIIVGSNNFSISYDRNKNLIYSRGSVQTNCQWMLKLHPNKSIKDISVTNNCFIEISNDSTNKIVSTTGNLDLHSRSEK